MANMALAYYKNGNNQQAIDTCAEILSVDDQHVKSYYIRAMASKCIITQMEAQAGKYAPSSKIRTLQYKVLYDIGMFNKLCDPLKCANDLLELQKTATLYKKTLMYPEPNLSKL